MIKKEALFSDETEMFKTPYEPRPGDGVKIYFRTLASDVKDAWAVMDGERHPMEKCRTDASFDYYVYSFVCGNEPVRYHFEAADDDERVIYNRLGCGAAVSPGYDFLIIPGLSVPDWAKGAVYYQIFTDRFCNGEKRNDVDDREYYYTGGHSRRIEDWYRTPEPVDVNCFYGGDLQGVMSRLDYLQGLGIDAIYFNPLFVSPSNHKYDTQDYDHIDPHLAVIKDDVIYRMEPWEKDNAGAVRYIKRVTSRRNLEESNAYFASLVDECHKRGIKVVMDGVFDHCGSFNKWMDREGIYRGRDGYGEGAYGSADSRYRKYFRFDENGKYDGWWGYETMPKFYYENSDELVEEIMKVGEKWVSAPYRCDGWRLDVAADIGYSTEYNHRFWKEFRERVRRANPEAIVFAEHYGDMSPWLDGGEWDSVMNYDAFMEPVTWFLTGMEKHSGAFDAVRLNDGEAFFDSMFRNMAKFPRPALDSALNQLSNHDHSRFMTRTNRTVGTLADRGPEAAGENTDRCVFMMGVMIQMTWPGAPGIYYGDEAGVVGWTDPDNRRTYPWGREDTGLIEFHRELIALRHRYSCLRCGSLKKLAAGEGYIVYGRFDGTGCCVVVINNSDSDMSLGIPVWEIGVAGDSWMVLEADTSSPEAAGERQMVFSGILRINSARKSGKILAKTI